LKQKLLNEKVDNLLSPEQKIEVNAANPKGLPRGYNERVELKITKKLKQAEQLN
jgi:hypothetical protein